MAACTAASPPLNPLSASRGLRAGSLAPPSLLKREGGAVRREGRMSSHPRTGPHHTLQGAGSIGRPLSNLDKGARFVAIVRARDDHKHAVGDPNAKQPFYL